MAYSPLSWALTASPKSKIMQAMCDLPVLLSWSFISCLFAHSHSHEEFPSHVL